MKATNELEGPTGRYASVSDSKSEGATYTPRRLAEFVAQKIVSAWRGQQTGSAVRILDPAAGDGELLLALVERLNSCYPNLPIEVFGFEPNLGALELASERLSSRFPEIPLHLNLAQRDFLEYVVEEFGTSNQLSFCGTETPNFDLIISNPPYVRTQVMGSSQAQLLGRKFSLTGRVDLYHAFMLAIARVLKPEAVAGMIVSNRFMTTRSGSSVRRAVLDRLRVLSVWDFGDTKLFEASVLPAVVLACGTNGEHSDSQATFTSIYETTLSRESLATDPVDAVSHHGVVEVSDGRRFNVRHGCLETGDKKDGVWRIANEQTDAWLATVAQHTWGKFQDIGKIRVGVKTCADKVFIRSDWDELPSTLRPELLRPILTHHSARRFKAITLKEPKLILYTHEVRQGLRRAIELSRHPLSAAYLETYRRELEGRAYVTAAGRNWFEIWVPQDPSAWGRPKLVFRDIADAPTFWIDLDGSVVNGDCYWLAVDESVESDLLWLAAAVGNSSFIQRFYDYRFQNRLYAGRRRFMTQYVEEFPLPNPSDELGCSLIAKSKEAYASAGTPHGDLLGQTLDRLVWEAFGLPVEESAR